MSNSNADRKLLALGIKAAKFTAEELEKIIGKFLEHLKNGFLKAHKMPYEEFQSPGGVSLLNLAPKEHELEPFEEVAQKNNVHFTLKHDRENGTYYLTLEGKNDTAIVNMLKSYQKQRQNSKKRDVFLFLRR